MGLKNQKSYAVDRLLSGHIPEEILTIYEKPKREVKNLIRNIADVDEGFENIVFEIGCEVLAKEVKKKRK